MKHVQEKHVIAVMKNVAKPRKHKESTKQLVLSLCFLGFE